ncbi:hypothetical protein [Algoriphagus litoralis]|uniref:hypothetical protein n=1 Tax=Algoriphagus litoralis TaxID=2202829 RepID=UPI000DB93778|nr:hypothetical protein [Algoriphagus litoralis]
MNTEELIVELIIQDLRFFQISLKIRAAREMEFCRFEILQLIIKAWGKSDEIDYFDLGDTYMEYMKEVKFQPFSYYGEFLKPLALKCYKGLINRIKELEANPSLKYGETGGFNRMEK